jgi:hypothetical protein
MKKGHKITLEIPDEIFSEIVNFKKKVNISDNKSAIFELIKYALSFPSYFKNFDWEKAEKEADDDIKSGNAKRFSSVDDFLINLGGTT